jgi:ATP phosphoribosyltransferase regulatory subunit HisZ
MLQAGIELVGAPGPEGTAEALAVLCEALDAVGLTDYRVGLGDASLYPRLLDRLAVPEGARAQILKELVTRDFVGLEREVAVHGRPELLTVPQTRGGVEVLDAVPEASELRAVYDLLAPAVADRVIFDLGLIRSLGYYTGAVFEVYDAGLGAPIGGGGRYDDLVGRFGRDLPACGWALNVERLHLARVGEGR